MKPTIIIGMVSRSIFIFFSLSCSVAAFATPSNDCRNWFHDSKLKPNTKDCEVQCDVLKVDMSTFMCHDSCAEFCNFKCPRDPFWDQKIKDGRPPSWPFNSEKSVPWSKADREALLVELNRLPNQLQLKNLAGIYRMSKSIQVINPGSHVDGSIVLYDHAFDGMCPSKFEIVVHEIAHVLAKQNLNSYNEAVGWQKRLGSWKRNGEFLDPDAEGDPDEDFASSITTYLIEPSKLRQRIPSAYTWVSKNFKNLKLEKECRNDAKK